MTDDHQTPPPAYTPPATPHNDGNGLAVASLVLGILSILTAWIPIIGLIAWVLAPLGLIFGFISLGKSSGKGLAIGGLITSGLGLLICIAWVTFFSAIVSQAQREGAFDNLPAAVTAPSTTSTDADTPTDQGAGPMTDEPAPSTGDAPASDDGAGESGHDQSAPPPSN